MPVSHAAWTTPVWIDPPGPLARTSDLQAFIQQGQQGELRNHPQMQELVAQAQQALADPVRLRAEERDWSFREEAL